jgi:hypothetical protein
MRQNDARQLGHDIREDMRRKRLLPYLESYSGLHVSNARVWAGVHYRFSTEVGEAMGRQIGHLAILSETTWFWQPNDETLRDDRSASVIPLLSPGVREAPAKCRTPRRWAVERGDRAADAQADSPQDRSLRDRISRISMSAVSMPTPIPRPVVEPSHATVR